MRRSSTPGQLESLERRGLFSSLVYGPVRSRRLGLSLGINPLPMDEKLCSFNCPYCQFGWTDLFVSAFEATPQESFPSVEDVGGALREALEKFASGGVVLDSLTFAGNGEPTLHPAFLELVEETRALRDRLMPGALLSVLTNGSTLHRPDVVRALNLLDERVVKLDAGDERSIRAVNLPHESFDLEGMIASIPKLVDCVLQSMFVRGRVDNTAEDVISAWAEKVAQIAPLNVQIYSIDRVPADLSLEIVPKEELKAIAHRCESMTGVPCEVY